MAIKSFPFLLFLIISVSSQPRLYNGVDTSDVKYLLEALKYCEVDHKIDAFTLGTWTGLFGGTDSFYVAQYAEKIPNKKGFYSVTTIHFQAAWNKFKVNGYSCGSYSTDTLFTHDGFAEHGIKVINMHGYKSTLAVTSLISSKYAESGPVTTIEKEEGKENEYRIELSGFMGCKRNSTPTHYIKIIGDSIAVLGSYSIEMD